RKKASAELAEADERLRLAVESAGMGTFDYYPDTNETKWSERASKILGLPAGQNVDLYGFLSRVHPEDRSMVELAISRAKDPAIASEYDVHYRIIWPDGTTRWIIARGRSFFLGQGAGRRLARFTGMVLDVTESKKAEQERDKLIAIIQHSPDLIGLCDPTGKLLFANRAGQAMVGINDDSELAGTTLFDFIPQDEHWRIQNEVLPSLRPGQVWEGEVRLRNIKTGEQTLTDVLAFGIFDQSGRLTAMAAVSRDVSEKRKLEEQLRQAQKMEAVGRLAGGIAHDFNNLLTIIRGSTELLQEYLTENPVGTHLLRQVLDAGIKASSLTRQLLAFSRQQLVQPRPSDLNTIIDSLRSMLRRLVGEDIKIETELASDLWLTRLDPTQVDQILINMTANARDAMAYGGAIMIRTENVTLNSGKPGEPAGEFVKLTFRDTGGGIDAESLPHIFEPFFSTKQRGKGTGLGLATVYGIVQQAGGNISVTSEPGHGTTFMLYFPRTADRAEAQAKAGEPSDLHGSETVLLVEDEPVLRGMIAEYLDKYGYIVHEASNAAEAEYIAATQSNIDLLITDLVMPGGSGRDLMLSIASMRPDTRVLFMSGYFDHAVLEEALRQSGAAFIQKPFQLRDIAVRVREILNQRLLRPYSARSA
ncbi:MAG TPA: ATP-binding protein, partial [Candidatus Limnocylindrales bacterium]|nr:ATP-binding protein [Candidatus Limnocylindrales bacterium]